MSALQTALILISLPLLVAIALCAASETALFSLTPGESQRLSQSHPRVARLLRLMRMNPRGVLVSVLLVANAVNVAFFVATSLLAQSVANPIAIVALEVAGLVILVLAGDLLPKLIARRHRMSVVPLLARLLIPIFRVISPIRAVLEALLITPLVRLLHPPERRGVQTVSAEELGVLLEGSFEGAGLLDREQWLLGSVVELSTIRVRDVMTPRVDAVWLERTQGEQAVLEALKESSVTWLPVCDGSVDDGIVGVLDVRAYLATVLAARSGLSAAPATLGSFLVPAVFVPDHARLDRVIETIMKRGVRLGICVNELGAVVGTLTPQQVLTPLLTTPAEAHWGAVEGVRKEGQATWSVPGRLGVKAFSEYLLGSALQTKASTGALGRVSSVGGFIISVLGRVPRVGDQVSVGTVKLRVTEMAGRSVERVQVSLSEKRP